MVTVCVCNATVNANPFALTGFCIFKQFARNTAAASASHCQVEKSTRKKNNKKESKREILELHQKGDLTNATIK